MAVSNMQEQWYSNALKLARAHNSTGRYSMCALLVKGNRVLAAGFNYYPGRRNGYTLHKDYLLAGMHAELQVLTQAIAENATLYIAGVNFNGKEICSRPCHRCTVLLKNSIVKRIVYYDDDITQVVSTRRKEL